MKVNSQQKWKYTTIGLAAILALVVTTPQASAHVTTNLAHNVQHILDAIINLQSDLDALAGDAATGADVDNLEEKIDDLAENNGAFQIIRGGTISADVESADEMSCTSDFDFILHVFTDNVEDDVDKINVYSGGSLFHTFLVPPGSFEFTQGGYAGETLRLVAIEAEDLSFFAHITLETAAGATASCTRS